MASLAPFVPSVRNWRRAIALLKPSRSSS